MTLGLTPLKGPFKSGIGKLAKSLPTEPNIRNLGGIFERRGDPMTEASSFNQREHHERLLANEPFHSDNFQDPYTPRFPDPHHGSMFTSEPSVRTHHTHGSHAHRGRETRDRLKCIAIGLHHTLIDIRHSNDKDLVA